MSAITAGSVHAFYLFDVAQAIDLAVLRAQFGDRAGVAQLLDKTPGPPRVRYFQPPVIVDGAVVGVPTLGGFRVRVKFYDYGVISLMLSQPFAGSWSDLVRLGQDLIESEPLEAEAATACVRVVESTRTALTEVRATFLSEDYLAFIVSALGPPETAEEVGDRHGADIAQLLRGERLPLSAQEREEVLRHRLSYLTDDLVVPAYNAAFVLDSDPAALATLEILEFVNSQLLEFRYHDELLETELTSIYTALQQPRWVDRWFGRRHTQSARRVHALFIDVNELTDRMENAVKLVGDIYSARLFNLTAARVGLDAWKRNVEDKLETLDDIYRFAVEQTGMSQGNLLELVIVFILIIELGLFFAGIMK
ncbi:MAG TPA: hypothetical protein VES67_21470 [Vicinamibacterales bacterium]|nr:hypothetical protein [Vicinamibacterales bacterium]